MKNQSKAPITKEDILAAAGFESKKLKSFDKNAKKFVGHLNHFSNPI